MCLSFKYPLIWGNLILLPSPPPLVLVLEDRWGWGVYMGVVHTCTHMCFIDAMEAYLKEGRGPQQSLQL